MHKVIERCYGRAGKACAWVFCVLFWMTSSHHSLGQVGNKDKKICLPPGVKSVTNDPQSELVLPKFKKDGQVFVFFDASTNMKGFVPSSSGPSQSSGSSYAQLVHVIPDIVNKVGVEGRFHRYRRELSPLSGTQISRVTNPQFYACDAGTPLGQCDDPRNQLEQILALANRFKRGALTVITSDFNLVDEEVRSREPGSISDSLSNLFRKGNSFGLYATKSEYKGIIHGLPGGVPYDRALERPFYVLLIGPIEKIIRFRKLLTSEFGKGRKERRERFFIFTNKLITNRITEKSFKKNDYDLIDGANFASVLKEMPEIPQFSVPGSSGLVRLEVDLAKVQIPETLPLDKFETTQNIWMHRPGGRDCSRRWFQVKSAKSLVSVQRQGTRLTLDFFSDRASMKTLPTNRPYFLSLNITAGSTSLSDDDKEWLAGWSFDVTGLNKLVEEEAAFFPTLNLKRFVGVLSMATSGDAFNAGAIFSFNSILTRLRR